MTTQRLLSTTACLAMALVGLSPVGAAPPRYAVLKIGESLGPGSHPLNDLGQVVGTVGFGENESNAFLTQPNMPFNFFTDRIPGTKSGFGVNDAGQVVGNYALGDGYSNGYRTRPGQPFVPAIDGVGSFGFGSQAFAINSLGQVTGEIGQAYRLNMGETISLSKRLGTLGGNASAGRDINDAGQVVGESLIAGNQFNHAFRTGANLNINPLTNDLGTLGGNESFARAINASGVVAGSSQYLPGLIDQRAFRTQANQSIDPATDDLGTLGGTRSSASDINDAGWVVGSSTVDPNDRNLRHAFVHDGTTMWDLNDLIDTPIGLPLTFAAGINNSGQILAGSSVAHYLLTPIPVPEPSTVVLFGASVCVILLTKKAKRPTSPRLATTLHAYIDCLNARLFKE